ncbi:unnamed protein product [Cyclocybe aegerita]|uniref:EH domain-containing protein n=1 Tax=Cyclocybe aegerita TaxID=1973307 RepID=A0A8S0WP78_CYCAE|nr:unnamed protein product [Cyclocybe aegerita]
MTSQLFTPTEEELELAAHILASKGLDGSDSRPGSSSGKREPAIKGEQARDIFNRSGLPFVVLRDVWAMADENGSGDLEKREIAIALRLIGWVQAGEGLRKELLATAGPLPTLDGITNVPQRSNVPNVPQITLFPPVSMDDLREYKRMFDRARPDNGFLKEEQLMEAFMTSNLSYENIRRIIQVIHQNQYDAFDFREFALGMYLVQALQSSLLHTVPTSIPLELYDQFNEPPPPKPKPKPTTLPQRSRSTSLQIPSSRFASTSPSSSGQSTPSPRINGQDEYWGVPVHEQQDADRHFYKLDEAGHGFLERDIFEEFVSVYKVPTADLERIQKLADFNSDGRLARDGFNIAMHLIKRRLAGEEVPATLPASLIPPSIRTRYPSSPTSPSLSPKMSIKKSPPPVPPKKRDSISKRPDGFQLRPQASLAAISSLSGGPSARYSVAMSPPPLSPPILSRRPTSVYNPAPVSTSPPPPPFPIPHFSMAPYPPPPPTRPPPPEPDDPSPFDDPQHQFPVQEQSPPLSSVSPPSDQLQQAALEEFKKETTRLSEQVDTLMAQLVGQNRLRDLNDTLRAENDRLKTQVREMERTVSEVLSANELAGTQEQEQYLHEITRLSTEVANKETQCENAERMVAVLTQDERELRESLREANSATAKAKAEAEELKEAFTVQQSEIKDLKMRLADMGKAMAEPDTATNNRELRVLFRDVTRENENLKSQVRDMQRSMEQLLLTSKQGVVEEMGRENRRLRNQVQELELVVTQLHSTSSSNVNGTGRDKRSKLSKSPESYARENEQLKGQLRDGQRQFAEFRSTSETRAVELQQRLDTLTEENERLKAAAATSAARRQQTQEDNSAPPPAYDDTFVIPPETQR